MSPVCKKKKCPSVPCWKRYKQPPTLGPVVNQQSEGIMLRGSWWFSTMKIRICNVSFSFSSLLSSHDIEIDWLRLHCSLFSLLYICQGSLDGAKSSTNLRRRLTRWTPGAPGDFLEHVWTHLSSRCPAGSLSLALLVISSSPAKLLLLIFSLPPPPLSTINFQCVEASFQPCLIPVRIFSEPVLLDGWGRASLPSISVASSIPLTHQ